MSEINIYDIERAAEAFQAEQKFDEAIAKLLELLEVDPKFARAHLTLSFLYRKVHKPEESVQHAEKAVELEPKDPHHHMALSVAYQQAFEATQDPKYIPMAENARDRSRTIG